MVNSPRITDSEKQLLHAVGSNPEASIKELLEYTEYKWERTIKRKLKRLKEQDILQGPMYYTNYSRLCKNPLHKVVCIIESNQSYETVISYLKMIESLLWILPVLSPHKRVMKMMYYSTDNEAMIDILQLLKENGIISDYVFRVMRYRGKVENPNLYGDINPVLDNLLDPCDIPDMSLQPHDTAWNECDIAVLPYLERGTRLIEILRKENHNSKTWTYEQIKYSREKMVKNGLIEKLYMFFPFPLDQCLRFGLFLKTEDAALTHRIVHNFARGERINKQCALHEGWGDINIWGSVGCASHPLFLKDLMHKLDAVEEIVEKEVYQIRSFPHKKYFFSQPSRLDYYDVETQTLEYPYHVYEEKIKEKIEQEPVIISM
jgi:DNA-binding Lrp family transcriptional regulator